MSVPSNVVSMRDPQIPIDQGIYEESTTLKTQPGTRLRVGNKTFYYAKAGTALVAGNVYCSPAFVATKNLEAAVALWTIATGTAKTLSVTVGTDVAANAFAEGDLILASAALSGGGIVYKIKSHGSIASAAAGSIVLYDDIPTSSVAAGPVCLIANQFNGVVLGSQLLDMPAGVAPIAVTSGNYAWLQTWGPAGVKQEAATPAAAAVALGSTGGVIAAFTTGTLAGTGYGQANYILPIGKSMGLAATATQVNPVYLMITP